MVKGSMPWQTESTKGDEAREHFKYQYGYTAILLGWAVLMFMNRYHPGGDPRNPPRDAPSALHSVIVPNVNLPKVKIMHCYNPDSVDLIEERGAYDEFILISSEKRRKCII
jgi:hypothetical protein